jgi:hypothetical protein
MNLLNAYNFKNMDYAVLFVDGNLKEFQTREEMMEFGVKTKWDQVVTYGKKEYLSLLTTKSGKK